MCDFAQPETGIVPAVLIFDPLESDLLWTVPQVGFVRRLPNLDQAVARMRLGLAACRECEKERHNLRPDSIT